MINWGNLREQLLRVEKEIVEIMEDMEAHGLSTEIEENFPMAFFKPIEYNGKEYQMIVDIQMKPIK